MNKKTGTLSTILSLSALAFCLSLFSGCDQQQDTGVGTSVAPLTGEEEQDEATAAPQSQCSGDCSKGCSCPHKGKAGCDGNCADGCTCPCKAKGGCDGNCTEDCACPHKGKAGCDGNCADGCTCKKGCTCPHK